LIQINLLGQGYGTPFHKSGGKHPRADPLRTRTTEYVIVLAQIPVDMIEMIEIKAENAINVAACSGIGGSDLALPGPRAPAWEADLGRSSAPRFLPDFTQTDLFGVLKRPVGIPTQERDNEGSCD
jgi:hypothetical protein